MTASGWNLKLLDICNVLVSITVIYIIYNYGLTEGKVSSDLAISAVVLIDLLLLWLCSGDAKGAGSCNTNFRPAACCGIFQTIIIPMSHMGELVAPQSQRDVILMQTQLWLSLGCVSAGIARWFWVTRAASTTCRLLLITSFVIIMLHLSSPIAFCLQGIDVFIVWGGLKHIPVWLPKSFTFGELSVILQILVRFINTSALGYFKGSWLIGETYSLMLFTHTLLVAVVAATCITFATSSHSSVWKFILTYAICATAALGFLHVTMPETPLLWLINFITEGCNRAFLLITWFLLLAITLTWTANQSLVVKQDEMGRSENTCRQGKVSGSCSQSSKVETAKFTARKMFHVFIVLVYTPGLLVDPSLLFLASTVVFGLFIVIEAARALQVPSVGPFIDDVQSLFVDERDQGRIFLTHFYLLIGMSLPLWMSPQLFSTNRATPEMYAGVLALGIGDTVACLAGRAIGSIRWPGSKKTIEGTFCSILAQMVLVTASSTLGVVSITSTPTVLIGITLAALIEAFTDQIDNLILPLVLYPVLCFS